MIAPEVFWKQNKNTRIAIIAYAPLPMRMKNPMARWLKPIVKWPLMKRKRREKVLAEYREILKSF